MSSISNFTAKAKRKWYDGNSWHTDDLTFFQVASKDNYTGKNILYKQETYNSNNLIGTTNYVYDYYPGLVYKPKKYYKFTDLFYTSEHFSNLRTVAKNIWGTQKDEELRGFVNGAENSMIAGEKDGSYLFPICTFTAAKTTGALLEKRVISFVCQIIGSKFKPNEIKFTYENGSNLVTVNDNGTWRNAVSGDYYTFRDIFRIYSSGDSYVDWCDRVDKIFDNLSRCKFYFLASANFNVLGTTTIDGITYGQSTTPNYSSLKLISLIIDYSNCKTVSNNCFSHEPQYFYYVHGGNNRQFLYDVEFTTESSPSPTQNPDEDDPNDDDPGSQTPSDNEDPDYENDEGGDGDHDDSSDTIPEDPLPDISGSSNNLITSWNLSPSQLESLAEILWSPDAWEAIKQYFTNPMESILSLTIIPVAPKTTSGTIHLGGYNTGINAGRLSSDYVKFDCGSIPINRYYGSYLDYAPFTKITCTLPYIGEVDIDPDQVMQKTLSISYHINCITGEVVAYLLADNNVFATFAGNCVKQLPICQTDFSSIISGAVQICSTVLTATAGAAAAGVEQGANLLTSEISSVNAANSGVKASSSLLGSVMSMKANYKHSSQLGTGAGHLAIQVPFLTIIRPNLDLAENYKSFTGYPCNKNLQLSTLHGYTQVEASNLSVPSATLEELSEIKELLLKGVII